jgi:prepilin-type N-terminal cleavage/methylation domain-containing protein
MTHQPPRNRTLHRSAFTLIELLVVIAIIAILVSILLPALASAREQGRAVKCMSNMKQIANGYHSYAQDYKTRIWEAGANAPVYRFWYAQPEIPTVPLSTVNPAVPGPAFLYLGDVDRVFSCPTNKRRTPLRDVAVFSDPFWTTEPGRLQRELFNVFYEQRALNFDYTMCTGSSGARVDSPIQVAWDTRCRQMSAQQPRSMPPPSALSFLNSLPVFVEEDINWWNAPGPDGMWSNWDQITDRHSRKGHMAFLNGDVALVQFPRGGNPNSQNDTGDFVANDVWAQGRNRNWYQVAPTWPGVLRPYGWFDLPR